MSTDEEIIDSDLDDSYDVSESEESAATENTDHTEEIEPKPKPVRNVSQRQLKQSQTLKTLAKKNNEIAHTVKAITVNSLTPISRKKYEDKIEDGTPSWVKRAMEAREKRIQNEQNNPKIEIEEVNSSKEPEWIQKAKEAQISRDLRGLDRFVNKKAPELPPEPEWFSKACKRRDLGKLLEVGEKVHVSNVETPWWVHSSPAQKILNAFLHEDEGVIPDWMKKGVKMTNNEKNILLEQLEKLKEILEEEKKVTLESETFLNSSKNMLQMAENKLDESVTAYRSLRENRKSQDVQSFIDSSNNIFSENEKFMNKIRDEFEVGDIVDEYVEAQKKRDEVKRIAKEKAKKEQRKKRRGSRKIRSSTDKTDKTSTPRKRRHREKKSKKGDTKQKE